MIFLSTPSARRATDFLLQFGICLLISIHALREEGDAYRTTVMLISGYFYPRPPRGGRRTRYGASSLSKSISIHALREEGDKAVRTVAQTYTKFLSTPSARRATGRSRHIRPLIIDFYPRPPRGGRRLFGGDAVHDHQFLSTPSARRATDDLIQIDFRDQISIHALREEGDSRAALAEILANISIHALREEGD